MRSWIGCWNLKHPGRVTWSAWMRVSLSCRALELIRSRQDSQGRWLLEYDYARKTWENYGPKKQLNKWVTLRARRALKLAQRSSR